jgi:hypothetical protein
MNYEDMLIEFNAGKIISRDCWKLQTRQRVIKINDDNKSFSVGYFANQEIRINDDDLEINMLEAWKDDLNDWLIVESSINLQD